MRTPRSCIARWSWLVVVALLFVASIVPIVEAASETMAAAEASATQKIATTEAIRADMRAIRDLVASNHSLITHRRMPRLAALSFAAALSRHVANLRSSNSDAQVRQALEPLLATLEQGARAVAGTADGLGQIDGIVAIDEALARYAERFDHPNWKGAREN